MPLKLAGKQAIVAEVSKVAGEAIALAAADYRGLTVEQMTNLRVQARELGVYLRVVRNTLAKRAVDETEFACVQERLVGPLIFAFSQTEPGAAARLFRSFAKENEKLEVKFLSLGGELLEASQLSAIADLPTRDEALSQLLSVMKAPITKFVATLNEPVAQLVRTFGQVSEAKGKEAA